MSQDKLLARNIFEQQIFQNDRQRLVPGPRRWRARSQPLHSLTYDG